MEIPFARRFNPTKCVFIFVAIIKKKIEVRYKIVRRRGGRRLQKKERKREEKKREKENERTIV